MAELLYPELSYKITGLCYKTQNQLGTKFQEKHYLKALCALLDIEKIPYQTEVKFAVKFNEKILGTFRADIVIDNKILIELKTVDYLTSDHRQQLIRYLDSLNLSLALLINFRKRPLQIWRITKSRKH